eukprot:gb/GECG01006547.1/.p1 GENE.gb/GECG01006547.1/~~gb/GECG01006547.1/.p1  ORF type:complete len:100 (+),score=8.50 gb/GECG01006547.1/:1-300(+)
MNMGATVYTASPRTPAAANSSPAIQAICRGTVGKIFFQRMYCINDGSEDNSPQIGPPNDRKRPFCSVSKAQRLQQQRHHAAESLYYAFHQVKMEEKESP